MLFRYLSYFLTLLVIFTTQVAAQPFKFQLLDSKTKTPIAFAHVVYQDIKGGSISDIDGYVYIKKESKQIKISYVGYETNTLISPFSAKIYLTENLTSLDEIVVKPIENPAITIVKKAIYNISTNDVLQQSFRYNAYNKLSISKIDSTKDKELKQILKNNDLFISESYTQRTYKNSPHYDREIVLAHKTSGTKSPLMASILTDFQPLTFYQTFITLKLNDKSYLNPISTYALNRYDYQMTDTLITEKDTTFIIAFYPIKNTKINGFKGLVHINSNGYAIENIKAEPNEYKPLINIKFQQKYQRVKDKWVPHQQYTAFVFNGFQYLHKGYITDFFIGNIDSLISSSETGRIVNPNSYIKSDSLWMSYRVDTLSIREKNTYQFYENTVSPFALVKYLDKTMSLTESFLIGYLPIGKKVEMPLHQVLNYNQYEGLRIGIGFRSMTNTSSKFQIEAYTGIGLKDKSLKYGGTISFLPSYDKQTKLSLSYQQGLVEPMKVAFFNQSMWDLRNTSAYLMDSIKSYQIGYEQKIMSNGKIELLGFHEKRVTPFQQNQTNNTVFSLGFYFVLGQQNIQIRQYNIPIEEPKTQYWFQMQKGVYGILNSQFNYTKINAQIKHAFTSIYGKTSFLLSTGIILGDNLPNTYLYSGMGIKDSWNNSVYTPNFFQTMQMYEFIMDRYITGFLYHNIGKVFNAKKKFQPELAFVQGASWGSLTNKAMPSIDKGYLESGLIIERLYRFNYLNLMYFDFGGGVFNRWGNYAKQEWKDNLVGRFVIKVSL